MANEIKIKTGTPIVWANTDYVEGGTNGLTRTNQINLNSLAANAARQGEKVDLGALRPGGYAVKVAAGFVAAPTAGGPVEYYWSPSSMSHPASGNAGGSSVTGADAAWAPGGGAEADIDEWKQQLVFVGVLPAAADAFLNQVKVINSYFTPPERYGSWVVKNDTSANLTYGGSGMYVAMIPITDEVQ